MFLPKSKYKANLTASPGQYKIKGTDQEYVGPYFETYQGRTYTGATPIGNPREIVRRVFGISEDQAIDGNNIIGIPNEYDYVRDDSNEVALKATLPVPLYYPKPSTGTSFTRYFAIEKNTKRVVEVSKDTYLSMKKKEPKYYYPKYDLTTLEWSLSSVSENRINSAVTGLDSYLKDPSQFVR